jgi:hypothetical protein
MTTHRITHIAAVALAIAAASAPVASAKPLSDKPHHPTPTESSQDMRNADNRVPAPAPQDMRNADNRVPAATPQVQRGISEPIRAAEQPQDLRSADTRDYAEGRGTYNSPEVVVVGAAKPVTEPTPAGGIDWADVGIGAGGLLGVALIGLGGALAIVHRRGARGLAS